jgi:hypothetical protein
MGGRLLTRENMDRHLRVAYTFKGIDTIESYAFEPSDMRRVPRIDHSENGRVKTIHMVEDGPHMVVQREHAFRLRDIFGQGTPEGSVGFLTGDGRQVKDRNGFNQPTLLSNDPLVGEVFKQ